MICSESDVVSSVEFDILLRQQLDWHVVDGGHLLLQHNGMEQGLNALVALHECMLGDEERNAALAHALGVLGHHVVAHDLDVAAVGAKQELAHQMGFRVEGDAMVNMRMRREKLFENLVELCLRLAQGQIDVGNLDLGEVIAHVVAEARLTVGLLLRAHMAVLKLFHHHDFLLFRCDEHHHAGSEIAALKRVLTEECQRLEVGQVGVEQDEGDVSIGQLVGELAGDLQLGGHHDDTVGVLTKAGSLKRS